MKSALVGWLLLGGLWSACTPVQGSKELRVGSKSFTENVIIAEMATQTARRRGLTATHLEGMGDSQVLWKALRHGDIHLYPDYTGTIAAELLHNPGLNSVADIRRAVAPLGLGVLEPLGFNNTYAIGMRRELAERLGVRSIGDLRHHPGLHFAFTHEFLQRDDGWKLMQARYALPQREVVGIEHELAYRALAAGSIAITDLYATDAEIERAALLSLSDDLKVFPAYHALLVYRLELEQWAPQLLADLKSLSGTIASADMVAMNARVKFGKEPEARVAADFLGRRGEGGPAVVQPQLWQEMGARTREHLGLVVVSLCAAVVVALPLGIYAARRPRLGQGVLAVLGIVQTIPSLALLVFTIPLLGIGSRPAMVALFLYSLLPIVRNTCTGLKSIPAHYVEAADALGLHPVRRLLHVELPLAAPHIMAGIKTAGIINVGTATLGAMIGAGGYGQPIVIGIRNDDIAMILQGAVPAALLALAVQALFALSEQVVLPRGWRQAGGRGAARAAR